VTSAMSTTSPPRPLPVILLVDTSGSMSADGKIGVLDTSIEAMARDFATRELEGEPIQIAVIAFGGERAELVQPLVAAGELVWRPLHAAGQTPLGEALALVRALLEDPRQFPGDDTPPPTLVLVSDGRPTDAWRPQLEALLTSEYAAKASRFAIAIGADADWPMLRAFLQGTDGHALEAYETRDIADRFRHIAMAIGPTKSAHQTFDELDLQPQPDLNALDQPDLEPQPDLNALDQPDLEPQPDLNALDQPDLEPDRATTHSMSATTAGGSFSRARTSLNRAVSWGDFSHDDAPEVDEREAGDAADPDDAIEAGEREIVAEDGRVWHLDRVLGHGGQGKVYTLAEGSLVAKLLKTGGSDARGKLSERLASVQRLPLEGLPIARPLAQLRAPRTGYVMRLVDDVALLADLSTKPPGADARRWYAQTGGLRRRLRLLARLADVLDRMHARAIVYGDLSLANVLASASPEHNEVWLIDPDNLHYTSAEGSTFHTKRFAAPELLEHRGTSSPLTDAHALAVVVYKTLTGSYPFERSGTSALDIGPEHLLSRRLLALAHETFVAGFSEPARRARPGRWAAELERAADLCVSCVACEQSYLATGARRCPWCQVPRPRLALASIGVCDEQGAVHLSRRSSHVLARADEPLRLTRRHAFGEHDFAAQHELAGTLQLVGQQALFEPAVAGSALAERGAVRPLVPGERVELPAPSQAADSWTIRFTAPDTLQRLARLQIVPEEHP
jgi:uncharacterized protein YegL